MLHRIDPHGWASTCYSGQELPAAPNRPVAVVAAKYLDCFDYFKRSFGIAIALTFALLVEGTMKVNSIAVQASQHQPEKQPPAKAARELLSTQSDMADQPFGKLVSMLARGEEIPSGG
jgi:hypothetical protein